MGILVGKDYEGTVWCDSLYAVIWWVGKGWCGGPHWTVKAENQIFCQKVPVVKWRFCRLRNHVSTWHQDEFSGANSLKRKDGDSCLRQRLKGTMVPLTVSCSHDSACYPYNFSLKCSPRISVASHRFPGTLFCFLGILVKMVHRNFIRSKEGWGRERGRARESGASRKESMYGGKGSRSCVNVLMLL